MQPMIKAVRIDLIYSDKTEKKYAFQKPKTVLPWGEYWHVFFFYRCWARSLLCVFPLGPMYNRIVEVYIEVFIIHNGMPLCVKFLQSGKFCIYVSENVIPLVGIYSSPYSVTGICFVDYGDCTLFFAQNRDYFPVTFFQRERLSAMLYIYGKHHTHQPTLP